MIYKNNKTINEWYFNDAELIKVYKNGAICYYKIVDGSTPSQEPCFAVVNDITQYSDTEFVDVYDKATEKWYKLNNLNQYEEYGIYGSGRTITYYEGKLTIDNGYEYEWDGSEWNNLGEVSGSSRVPIGYTEVEYIQNTVTGTNYYIDAQYKPNQDTRVILEAQASVLTNNPRMFGSGPWNGLAYVGNIENGTTQKYYFKYGQTSTWYQTSVVADTNKHTFDLNKNSYYIDGVLAGTANTTTFQLTTNLGIFNAPAVSNFTDGETFIGKVFQCKIYDNGVLVRDFVPCKRDSDDKSGMYDIVNNEFYTAVNTSYNFTCGSESGIIEYPKYYAEKDEPENNVVFEDMEEALAYECPWVGMRAIIGGDMYIFSGDSQSDYGWVEITLPYDAQVEYLESDGTQYINTGVYLNTSNFEVGYDILGNKFYWGYTHQGSGNGTWISVEPSSAFFGKLGNNSVSITTSSVENTIKYESQSGITVNGNFYSKTFSIGSDSIANTPLYIFGRYDFRSMAVDTDALSKLKSFYLKNNRTLVVDMIPVRSNGVGYMYDRVSGQLFANAGTGSFIIGPDVQ